MNKSDAFLDFLSFDFLSPAERLDNFSHVTQVWREEAQREEEAATYLRSRGHKVIFTQLTKK